MSVNISWKTRTKLIGKHVNSDKIDVETFEIYSYEAEN